MGLPFAILRPVAALVGSVFGGWTVSRTAEDDTDAVKVDVKDASSGHDSCADSSCSCDGDDKSCSCHGGCECGADVNGYEYAGMSFGRKLLASLRYGLVDMVASVGKWLVIGLVVAALITVLVPDELFLSLSAHPILAMLVMILVAVPMYVCATGSIPIALSLMLKGLTPGVARNAGSSTVATARAAAAKSAAALNGRASCQFCFGDDTFAHYGSPCHCDIRGVGSAYGYRFRTDHRLSAARRMVHALDVALGFVSRSWRGGMVSHHMLGNSRRPVDLHHLSGPYWPS